MPWYVDFGRQSIVAIDEDQQQRHQVVGADLDRRKVEVVHSVCQNGSQEGGLPRHVIKFHDMRHIRCTTLS
jgi:hypothetical protein